MILERKELQRLLLAVKSYGNYYISNFNYEKGILGLPIAFNFKEANLLSEKLINFLNRVIINVYSECE